MEYYVWIARSVTQAQHVRQLLERAGVRVFVSRAPTALSDRGCSYAVRVRSSQWPEAKAVLAGSGIRPQAIYAGDGKTYREVPL